jgi:hypothetical protein
MLKILICLLGLNAYAGEIESNAFHMAEAPAWLTRNRAEKVVDRVQTKLEWTIRKIEVIWYKDQASFEKAHSLGKGVLAFARKAPEGGSIHLGPNVTNEKFDSVFGHELTHIIFGQKYKQAIPGWLEEGLANYVGRHDHVDYAYLKKQPLPSDVKLLAHPFKNTVSTPHYHYQASHALAEMIAKKCDMENLLRLSVGEKMDGYLDTYCGIKDVNAEFKKWVESK